MKRNIISVGLAALSLLGGFLPLASAGSYYVNIGHIGGVSYLLYPLSFLAAGLGVVTTYKPGLPHVRVWTGVISLAGLILTLLAVSSGMSTLEFMATSMAAFSFPGDGSQGAGRVSATAGAGGMLAIAGYLGLLICSALPVRSAVAQEGGGQ